MKIMASLTLCLSIVFAAASGAFAGSTGGTYSGTMHVSKAYGGATAVGTGSWSITIAGSGSVTGSQLFHISVNVAGVEGAAGCTPTPGVLNLDVHGTFSGNVSGANVVGSWRSTSAWSPSTFSVTCGGTSTSGSMPAVPPSTTPATFSIAQLKSGTPFNASAGGNSITYVPGKSTYAGSGGTSSGSSNGSSKGSSSGSTTEDTVPAVTPPSTPLPAPPAAPAPDSCHQVHSQSGSINICVPSWLSGSTSSGVRILDANGSVQSGPARLVPGGTVTTSADQYATFANTAAGADLSFAPSTSSQLLSADLTSSGLATCADLPENCTQIAAHNFLPTVKDALQTAIEGNPALAMLKVAGGIVNLQQDVMSGVQKAADILASQSTYDVPSSTSVSRQSHVTGMAKVASDVEMKVTGTGTYLFQISGSSLVINSASQTFETLKAGHVVFIPSSKSKAKTESLKKSTKTFKSASQVQWWG